MPLISRVLRTLSDDRLAHLAATGSDRAFTVLYQRNSGTLFAYCRSITGNADDGWDALQTAMIKALVSLRRSERTEPIRPWLFGIAHDEAVGILRRRGRRVELEDYQPAAAPSAWSPLAAWEMLHSTLQAAEGSARLPAGVR